VVAESPSRSKSLNTLQKNHFELFGLSPRYALDPAELERAYLAVQQVVHPDRFAAAGESQRRLALQLAARVNEAHQVLREPSQRAGYLCKLAGVDVALENNTAMPRDFLMLQMEWRETLDEIQADPAGLAKLRAEARSKAVDTEMRLQSLIDEHHNFPAAADLTRQLVFIEKFLEDLSHRG
jgi:molecular chaperone HscB